MPFDPDQATRPKVPTFKFGTIGDGFKMTLTDVTDDVDTKNDDGGTDTHLVLVGTIETAKGGDRQDPEDKDSPIIDTPVGESRSLWLRYRRDGKSAPAPLTTALALALKASGASSFQPGGTLAVQHTELGKKPSDARHSRAKLYTAKYEPPASPILSATGGSDDDTEFSPF